GAGRRDVAFEDGGGRVHVHIHVHGYCSLSATIAAPAAPRHPIPALILATSRLSGLRRAQRPAESAGEALAVVRVEEGADGDPPALALDRHAGDADLLVAGDAKPGPERVEAMLLPAARWRDLDDVERDP